MHLQEATSKDQVEQALASGDKEMQESVDELLDKLEKRFKRWAQEPDYDTDFSTPQEEIKNVADNLVAVPDILSFFVGLNPAVGVLYNSEGNYKKLEDLAQEVKWWADNESNHHNRYRTYGPLVVFNDDDRGHPRVMDSYNLYEVEVTYRLDPEDEWETASKIPDAVVVEFLERLKDLEIVFSGGTWESSTSLENWYRAPTGVHRKLGVLEGPFNEWLADQLNDYLTDAEFIHSVEFFIDVSGLDEDKASLLREAAEKLYLTHLIGEDHDENESHRESLTDEMSAYMNSFSDNGEGNDAYLATVLGFAATWADIEKHIADFILEAKEKVGPRFTHAYENGFFDEDEIKDFAIASDIKSLERALELYLLPEEEGPAVEKMLEDMKTSAPDIAADFAKVVKDKVFSKVAVLELAAKWTRGSTYQQKTVVNTIEIYLEDIKEGLEITDRVTLLTLEKEDLVRMGVTKGPIFEEAPWRLIKLLPSDLAAEGKKMRHCVGDSPTYAREVREGIIEIWSFRSRTDAPRFTFEIDKLAYKEATSPQEKGRAIKQLKGKANRTPGYDRAYGGGTVKFPEEVKLWKAALTQLGIDPKAVRDFDSCRIAPMEETQMTAAGYAARLSASAIAQDIGVLAQTLGQLGVNAEVVQRLEDVAFELAE